jgi:hypothetical protein
MHFSFVSGKMFGPLAKRYAGIEVHAVPVPGDVQFVYHTYHGFLVFFVQTEHRVSCPPESARALLGRFLRFNLTWGMLSYGLVFVPFLAFSNYVAQKRSIAKQEAALRMRQGIEGDIADY